MLWQMVYDSARHPAHAAFGHDGTAAKPRRRSWPLQWWRERRCLAKGGHWWHPDVSKRVGRLWYCCQCGRED